MNAVLRATPLALALVWRMPLLEAQSESLPPIFMPREPGVAPARLAPPVSLISDRIREAITERLLAEAKVFNPATVAPTATTVAAAMAGDPVMMDQLVVKSAVIRVFEVPRPDPFLLNYLKSGTLYHHVGLKVETAISLTFLPVQATGYGNREVGTRAQLSFSFRW